MKHRIAGALIVGGLWFGAATTPVCAARVFIPELELFLNAGIHNGNNYALTLTNRTVMSMQIDTFNKVAVTLRLGFDGTAVFQQNVSITNLPLTLELVSISSGTPFDDPVYVTAFVGFYDDIGLGDDFATLFNSRPVFSVYRGNRYAVNGERYDGLFQIAGTGLAIGSEFGEEDLSMRAYLYQDPRFNIVFPNVSRNISLSLNTAAYSLDLRALYDVGPLKIDTYAGVTFGNATFTSTQPPTQLFVAARGGIMLALDFPPLFQFYSQLGLPSILLTQFYTFSSESIMEQFQVLIEPRFNIADIFGIYLTALVRPAIYNQRNRVSSGFDLNLKLLFGDLAAAGSLAGGIDTLAQFNRGFQFDALKLSPFVGFTLSGIAMDFALESQMFPFMPLESLTFFINARTSF